MTQQRKPVLIAAIVAVAISGWAQTPPGQFEAVSIKPYVPPETHSEACNPRMDSQLLGLTGCTVKDLIQLGYALNRYQIPEGGPEWTNTDRYTIQARSSISAKRSELFGMLQSVLAERFRLKVHWDDREASVYVLKVAARGMKLSPATVTTQCGAVLLLADRLKADCLSMNDFAKTLQNGVIQDRPVVDRTNVDPARQFAFQLTFSPNDDPATGPSIFTALSEQLGLTLSAAREPVRTLVLDQVQRPDPN